VFPEARGTDLIHVSIINRDVSSGITIVGGGGSLCSGLEESGPPLLFPKGIPLVAMGRKRGGKGHISLVF